MLQIKNITKQYKTGELVQKALNGVSFCLRDSEFVSVLGPSGSGKTTLLNIIGGLDRYDSGDLEINGISTKNYRNKDWDTYRNHTIGFVFQSYNLIPHQSVLSNVELALTIGGVSPRERKQRAKKALEEVGLAEHMHKRPNQLSGGQMQRVAIARALVNDPDIVLADEPTGALDSETSVQIMEILKKVAENRLVVMVTHNGELAEEYSTRIIRLKDGRIISDSDPAGQEKENPTEDNAGKSEAAENNDKKAADSAEISAGETKGRSRSCENKKKARMSFLTCLALSANNLRSKKGRTILISLACSIGIVGIALILAVSTGVNDYILNIQKDTMSSYPLTISAKTMDLTGLMNDGNSFRSDILDALVNIGEDDGAVHTDFSTLEASEMFSTSIVENNLTPFKKYLDNPENEIHQYLGENGIVYTYNVNFDVYSKTPEGTLLNTNSSVEDITDSGSAFGAMNLGFSQMRTNMFSMQSGTRSSAANFSEMTAGSSGQGVSPVVRDNYDLVYGEWPENYDELAVVLTPGGTLPAETLYQLGIMSGDEYKAAAAKVEAGEEPEDLAWKYEDICGRTFYLVTASDRYMINEDGTITYLEDSYLNMDQLMEKAVELKVTGILRPSQNASVMSITTAVGYTAGLTTYCIEHADSSPIVQAQKAAPEVNVLTGVRFTADTPEQKAEDMKQYISGLPDDQKAQIYSMIMYYQTGGTGQEQLLGEGSSMSEMLEMFGMSDNAAIGGIAALMGKDTIESLMANVGDYISNEVQQAALLDKWLEETPDQEILTTLYDQYLKGMSYEDNMAAFGRLSYDAPVSINIYTDTFEDKDKVTECIDRYNESADEDSKIVYTDYISLITSSVTSIVNAISYVLIAFVAISLIVSCIMIGIITHISVLERTKEIGILRAMGASRRNISYVFNAETVIIGLISGIIGILVTLLLTLPINAILNLLLGESMINVNLPVGYGLLLILISVAVTMIGGIIPAAKASKKDPVIALRTE
ncbi:MAG: ABC transporter ATP-binding protein/permease [Parasporobacterium sp.]|nr:ABC transporter ATP-binding protein/permease [Parasporobacterium sp.]